MRDQISNRNVSRAWIAVQGCIQARARYVCGCVGDRPGECPPYNLATRSYSLVAAQLHVKVLRSKEIRAQKQPGRSDTELDAVVVVDCN